MSRVIFMCGPAGSGKTTIARGLEAQGMARLSFDDRAWQRGHRAMPLSDDVHRKIEAELREQLVGLVGSGIDVVLDFSFWSRQMREDWRRLLRPLGVEPETIYLATPREVVLARVRARAAVHADDFPLTEAVAAAYFDRFEPPTAAEGPLRIIE
ncbi:ATP-binding protein [Isoptericola sp. b441]|uniref:ATP-binding protein n=1 Tax=Actinotalea lenta TaxID=3064654 RepID=A0ABT9D877_9CELL|nr:MULTISPECIES: ATP-binding protein [unclassified Isoptericola]MDO8107084.1 ATP-binding protein [Isoptericola sp. b441]MDO8121202.1 ATP-binding protein [Isoptericola sp. b490]